MKTRRIIARLDVKGPNLVKGIQFEGLRKIGDPNEYVLNYYLQGVDEIFYDDIVASLYGRNNLLNVIENTTKNVFIPVAVGGGIRSLEDVKAILNAGADKVSINTAAIENSKIITKIAEKYGSQCVIVSIQSKFIDGKWEAFYNNGREPSGLDVIDWSKKVQKLGAGEILLTSIDKDGLASGMDLELIKCVTDSVTIPVIASGGVGNLEDIYLAFKNSNADAVALAHVLHYGELKVDSIRSYLNNKDIQIRKLDKLDN
jgi:cyclase